MSLWSDLGFTGSPYAIDSLGGSSEGATLLVGRERELRRLELAVSAGGPHASIEGPSGVGKSSLARVTAFKMYQDSLARGDGSLFLPLLAPMQVSAATEDFEVAFWLSAARTLLKHERDFLARGTSMPELAAIREWLESPTVAATGQVSAFGFGLGAGRALNTSTGFARSGFPAIVSEALTRCFPGPSAGAVIAIMDNIELLRTTLAAQDVLEQLRNSLFENTAIRWILVGSKGIITSTRSPRLSGYISAPMEVRPLTIDESAEIVRRRLRYWGTPDAVSPVQPSDFRYIYHTLGLNLRDSLALAQEYAIEYFSDYVAPGIELPDGDDRPALFQAWLAHRARSLLADLHWIPESCWGLLEAWCSDSRLDAVRPLAEVDAAEPLVRAHLVDVEPDPQHARSMRVTVAALGWLCRYGRSGATSLSPPSPAAQVTRLAPRRGAPVTLESLVTELSATGMSRAWASPSSSLNIPIGIGKDGVCYVDLDHEGTVTLVAGSTGSGKSEFMRSLAASLAFHFSPQDLTMLLVDYKGGGAFGAAARLPHVVGIVTDLDLAGSSRVAASLRAEVEIRRADKEGTYPRLVVLVDEFAVVQHEFEEFYAQLIHLSQIGRSLGIHVVLATQMASAISAKLLDQVGLRVVLSLVSISESILLTGSTAASDLRSSEKGRCILVHGDGRLEDLQSMYVSDPLLSQRGEWSPGHPVEETQLEAIARCATANMTVGDWRPPKLVVAAPLPDFVHFSDLAFEFIHGRADRIPFGLEDDPAQQRIGVAVWDMVRQQNMAIVGTNGSGRSTTLRTLVGSCAATLRKTGVAIVSIDLADGGLHGLRQLAPLISIANVAAPVDLSAICDQVDQLIDEQHRVSSNTAGRRPKRLVIVIDGWEQFEQLTNDGGATLKRWLGAPAEWGVHVVVAGGPELVRRYNINHALVLAVRSDDYISLELPRKRAAAPFLPGRALHLPSLREIQVARLGLQPSAASDVGALGDLREWIQHRL